MRKQTISSDTIARTIVLVLALVNQILAIEGKSAISFANSDIYQLVSLCWTIGASIAAWWKNLPVKRTNGANASSKTEINRQMTRKRKGEQHVRCHISNGSAV